MKDIVIIVLLGIIVVGGVFEGLKFYKKQAGTAAFSASSVSNDAVANKDSGESDPAARFPDIETSGKLNLLVEASGSGIIKGVATSSAEVFVNNINTKVDADGKFSAALDLNDGENIVDVVANDKAGNFDEKTLTVNFDSGLADKNMASVSGIVNSKTATQIVIGKDGKNYNVLFDKNTKFGRRFVGVSSFDEIKVGDFISVIGKWADLGNAGINASIIRDVDILKKLGIFFGTINSVNENGFVMKTLTRGDIKVIVAKNEAKVNERVRVAGLWDKVTSTINEVSDVKDFGI